MEGGFISGTVRNRNTLLAVEEILGYLSWKEGDVEEVRNHILSIQERE